MQAAPFNSMLLSQVADSSSLFTQLDLVNAATTAGVLDITLLHTDGTVLTEKQVPIGPNSKVSNQVSDLIPEAAGVNDGFLYIKASSGVYGVEMLGGKNLRFIATVDPQGANLIFVPTQLPNLPQITSVAPGTSVTPGSTPGG
jgi:hypothetical protein